MGVRVEVCFTEACSGSTADRRKVSRCSFARFGLDQSVSTEYGLNRVDRCVLLVFLVFFFFLLLLLR